MLFRLVFFSLICTVSVLVFAQHSHTPSANVIDGSIHPELIPDPVAYRLYFVAVSELPSATPEAKNRQLSHLGLIGMRNEDLAALIAVLDDFKLRYSDLISKYNAAAEAADVSGAHPALADFQARRDALVQMVRDELKQRLSAEGISRLDSHVQHEKERMRVAAKGAQ